MARKWLYIAAGIVAAFLLLVLLLPLFVNVNAYRPKIESLLETSLHRKVSLGTIHLSIFSGGVSVDNVSIADDPSFSVGNFLAADSISVGVKLLPLIFSRDLEVTRITVEKPVINLIRSASGTWNFSTLGSGSAPAAQPAAPAPASGSSGGAADVSIARLNVRDGKLSIVQGHAQPLVYDQLNAQITGFSYASQFPITLGLRTPGNGTVKLTGKAGPLDASNLAASPLEATLDVRNLNLASTGFVDAASGIAGQIDFTGSLTGDGKQLQSKGSVTASKLQLVPGSSPAKDPVKLDYTANYQLQPQTGSLTEVNVHIGKAVAHLTGTFSTAGETPSLQLRLTGDAMPLPDLQAILPAVNVALPSGTSLSAGTMNLNLAIAGPADKLVIAGPASLSDATLSGYDMGSKLGALGPFAGVKKSPNTVIQTFSADLRVAGGATNAEKIDLVVDGIGTITGSGTVGADQSLNFKMAAQLSGGALEGISKVAAGGKQGGGIPFTIRGTTSNPQFLPDVGGIAAGLPGGLGDAALSGGKGATTGVQGLGGAVGGLFGKKK